MPESSTDEAQAEPWQCAPYHTQRCNAAPTPLIVILLIGLNYIPLVLFCVNYGADGGRIVGIVVFHVLLAFVVVSWSYTCCTDPGTPPESWQRQMAAAVARGENVPVCRRSGLYKPPRSHFDSVTQRLTLNMDHFCPWVVNTVGARRPRSQRGTRAHARGSVITPSAPRALQAFTTGSSSCSSSPTRTSPLASASSFLCAKLLACGIGCLTMARSIGSPG